MYRYLWFVFIPYMVLLLAGVSSAGDQQTLPPPVFSHPAGYYAEPFMLELSTDVVDAVIYYTTDGSQPTDSSNIYAGPILIASREGDPNYFSEIEGTTTMSNPQPPAGEVYKIHVIRAKVSKPGYQSSEIITNSYFVDAALHGRYSLPVFSIAIDEDSLFDYERGIYVKGKEWYENQQNVPWWRHPANYRLRGIEWERPIHIEFFETNGERVIAQNAGVRIHGGASRSYPQKSLRIYSRSIYGESRFSYQFFPDKALDNFNRLILRNSGNDWFNTMFRDAMIQRLVGGLNFSTQAYRPAIVFINGEYWGIHNIRERYDKHYLEGNYGVDPDNIDLLTSRNSVKEGDNIHYNNVLNYIQTYGLADSAHYQYIQTQIDVDNFRDYQIAQIYIRNTDWPGNNIDFWRLRTDEYIPDAPYGHDGRWRWLMYDTDFGFGGSGGMNAYLHNTLEFATEPNAPGWPNPPWSTFLLRAFLENEEFKISFINRFADLLNTTFQPHRVISIIDEMQAVLAPEIHEHIHRWRVIGSVAHWESNVEVMRHFAQNRPAAQRQHILQYFGLDTTVTLSVDVSSTAAGAIQVNSIVIDSSLDGLIDPGAPYPWSGVYFTGIPLQLIALPYPGYSFIGWSGIESSADTVIIIPEADLSITAHFEYVGGISEDPMNPEPYDLSLGPYRFNYWPSDKPEGEFPPHMVFQQSSMSDPGLHDEMTAPYHIPENEYHEDDYENIGFPYRLTRRTRLSGWGPHGITFINTGRDRDLGAAVLALNTTGLDSIMVSWTAGTILPNSRVYAIRLQYRVGAGQPFKDVLDPNGNPVEYVRHGEQGHFQFMEPVLLPDEVNDQPYVQLRWKYYHVFGTSGPRAKLALDNILVTSGSHPHTLIPPPHNLSEGTYEFFHWAPDEPEGSFPPHMVFLQSRMDDPRLSDEVVEPYHIPYYDHDNNEYHSNDQDKIGFPYMLEGRTRITGLGDGGIGFINTGRGRDLGAAVLALNTTGQNNISVTWTGGTVIPNSRVYNIRLQYRVGTTGPFHDVLDNGSVVEYQRSAVAGHEEIIGPITLPSDVNDQPYVQLRWKYYYTGEQLDETDGRRDMLRMGTISVSSTPTAIVEDREPTIPNTYFIEQNYPNPFNPSTTIRYGLPQESFVTITIYSILGREVETLVHGVQPPGVHQIEWHTPPHGLASGVYFYRIEARGTQGSGERFRETRTMLLLK